MNSTRRRRTWHLQRRKEMSDKDFDHRYISFSGGVESTTMALLFGHKATPIWADTGYEHQAMYDRIERVEEQLKAHHGDDFEIIKVQRDGKNLPEYIKEKKFYPSFTSRFCTRMFKIEPIDDFMRDKGDCEVMIGLNADEGDRKGNHGLVENVTYTYPLLDLGITREQCKAVLDEHGLLPDLPPYMTRGGCVGCFYKSKKEYKAMAVLSPEEADYVADLEQEIQDERDAFYSIKDDIPSMKRFIEETRRGELFEPEEMYPKSMDKQTSCGVFCHR